MARTLRLPRADGTLTAYRLTGATPVAPPAGPIRSRIAYAAVHVVADPLAAINPTLEAALDWDATLAYRRYIWSLGLAVAEAMDTSQRGMGFDWSTAKELIRRAVAEARGIPGAVIAMRRRFPRRVRMYTGDDFDYPTTIRGDGERWSDALLGIFDVIAPAASAALHALDGGDLARYGAILAPTLPLSRHVFGAPTRFYKTGVVFAAYLNGHQSHFRMVGGLESARSVVHLAEQFVLMDRAGLLRDPDIAAERMRRVRGPRERRWPPGARRAPLDLAGPGDHRHQHARDGRDHPAARDPQAPRAGPHAGADPDDQHRRRGEGQRAGRRRDGLDRQAV